MLVIGSSGGVLTVAPACVEEKRVKGREKVVEVGIDGEREKNANGSRKEKITRTITGRETPLDFKNTSRPGQQRRDIPPRCCVCSHSPTQMNYKITIKSIQPFYCPSIHIIQRRTSNRAV